MISSWRKKGRKLCLFLTMVLFLACFTVNEADAASFSGEGKGTAKNPYLVTTAEQVNEIRNNLAAHYKLANNIDMSSIKNFAPIGTFSDPFTGTFKCDTDSSGKPKYIIKNLTVNLDPPGATLAEKYSGHKADKSMRWEAGFFGQTKGATLTNIVILDAIVTSTVEGNSQMNSDWSTNPGQSLEQSAGVLVGTAIDTKITGCGASGSVSSASNNTGGLIGTVCATSGASSSVKNSYFNGSVKSTGVWNSGGFCGGNETHWGKNTGTITIESCYFQGTFSGSYTAAGAFCGPIEHGTIKNCWASGTVKTSSSGCFYATDVYGSGIKTNLEICTNTYTLATIEGRTKAQTNKKVTNNNWITDAVGGLETGFAAGSMDEINAAFKGVPGWTVASGSYPQLANVKAITSAAGYDPVALPSNNTAPETGTENTGETVETPEGDESTTIEEPDVQEDSVSTVVEVGDTKMGQAEKILIAVLAAFALLLVLATIYVIVRWGLLIRRVKKTKACEKTEREEKTI